MALVALAMIAMPGLCTAQQTVTYRSAVVALTADAELRKSFEDALVAKARGHSYDATTSYDIEPDANKLDGKRFMQALASHGIQAVLVLRPAAIGPGASLESVRDQVPNDVYRNMRAFAKHLGTSEKNDLVAVVHMAVYILTEGDAQLISAGAVWLDESVTSREEGQKRLEDLIVANVDAARPAIRQRLRLPPLP